MVVLQLLEALPVYLGHIGVVHEVDVLQARGRDQVLQAANADLYETNVYF